MSAALQPKNRIKELRNVPLWQVRENPKNWRIHPEAQQRVMREALDVFGIADAMLVYERVDDDGKVELVMIDGHLRKRQIDENAIVPVLVIDVTDKEADALLATHDAIGQMASTDEDALQALLADMQGDDNRFSELSDGIKSGLGMFEIDALPTDLADSPIQGDFKAERPVLVVKFATVDEVHDFMRMLGYEKETKRTLTGADLLERIKRISEEDRKK